MGTQLWQGLATPGRRRAVHTTCTHGQQGVRPGHLPCHGHSTQTQWRRTDPPQCRTHASNAQPWQQRQSTVTKQRLNGYTNKRSPRRLVETRRSKRLQQRRYGVGKRCDFWRAVGWRAGRFQVMISYATKSWEFYIRSSNCPLGSGILLQRTHTNLNILLAALSTTLCVALRNVVLLCAYRIFTRHTSIQRVWCLARTPTVCSRG